MTKNVRVFCLRLGSVAALGVGLGGCSDGPTDDVGFRSSQLECVEGMAAAAMVAELETHLGPEALTGFGERESAAQYSDYLIQLAAQCPPCEEVNLRAGRPVPMIDGLHYGLGFLDSADTGLTCAQGGETTANPPEPTAGGETGNTEPPDTDPPKPCLPPFDTCPSRD